VTFRLSALSLAAFGGLALFALAPAAYASNPRPMRELRCDLMETARGRLLTIEAPGLHVLQQTAASGRFAPAIPAGTSAIMCARSHVIPAANDDEVISLGLPLFIAEMGTPGRLGVLEIDAGHYRFRMLEGQLTAEEQSAVDGRLGEFQGRLQLPQS
jgi:hypothetical protein